MPPRLYPSREHLNSSLSLNRLSVSATSQHGTVIGQVRGPTPGIGRFLLSTIVAITRRWSVAARSAPCHRSCLGGRNYLLIMPRRDAWERTVRPQRRAISGDSALACPLAWRRVVARSEPDAAWFRLGTRPRL
jgi:hypothetical protein